MSEALADIVMRGVAAHEKFVADSRAMDVAFANGTLDEWVKDQQTQVMKELSDGGGNSGQGDEG